jgi:hypothetical protein
MMVIELEGMEYNLPEGWGEINLEKFEKLVKHFSILSEYKSQYQYAIELFSILLDAPIESLSKITKGSFEILSEKIKWSNEQIESTGVKEWVIDGEDYIAIKNLNSLEMGEMVSLELQITNSKNWEMLSNVLPILVRKVKVVNLPNGEIKKVPEKFDADNYEETKELFRKHLMVADVNELKDFF